MNNVTTKAYDFPHRTGKNPTPKALPVDPALRRRHADRHSKDGPVRPAPSSVWPS